MSLTEGGNSAVDFCWERECYDSNCTEANEIFAELIRSDTMQAVQKSLWTLSSSGALGATEVMHNKIL